MYHRMEARLEASGLYRYLPLVLVVLHFLVFLFVLIATPLDVFKARQNSQFHDCASMFGWKPCGARSVVDGFHCGISGNMNGAAAFAIISIFVTMASFVLLMLSTFDVFKKSLIVLIVDGVGCLTILVSWGCVAGAYNLGTCVALPYSNISYNYAYGPSFGLMVTAWVLEILAIVGLFFLPM